MTKAIYMTDQGLLQARNDLRRKHAELEEISRERTTAHELSGDGWHDNPHLNRMQQLEAEKTRDIAALQRAIENTRVVSINPTKRPAQTVMIGSLVRIRVIYEASGDEKEMIWEIVGWNETKVAARKLAYNTPMAQAFLAAEVGEEVVADLPGGRALIEVLALLQGTPVAPSATNPSPTAPDHEDLPRCWGAR